MRLPQSPTQVYLAVEPVDMRLGADGLSLHVQQSLGKPPCDGNAYAFRNKNGNRIKLLIWDGTGVWLCVRRLHQGRFIWPTSQDKVFTLSETDWNWLTSGIDWQRMTAQPSASWLV
jgi:transposase